MKNRSCDKNIEEYHKCKVDLDLIYDNIGEGVKIRSKCQWHEESKKWTKYSLNIKKKQSGWSVIQRSVTDKKDIVKQNKINNEISLKGRITLISWITTLH